jgi:MFS family permease
MTVTDVASVTRERESLFAPRYRVLTTCIVLLITLLAFDEMAITSIMPLIARDLHGVHLYAWAFSLTLIGSLVGTVAGGGWADASGPAAPMMTGTGTFLAGLLTAGLAPDMGLFVAGRVIQGLGAGTVITGIYVLVARAYPEQLRPRVFAVTSAAWVVPSLVGPTVAAVIAQSLSWRVVFLGLIVLVAPAAIALRPALRPGLGGTGVVSWRRLAAVAVVAAGTAALLWGIRYSLIPVAVAGVAGLCAGLPRLLPAGALRLRRGLPAAVVTRGLMSAAFFGTEVFIPLGLIGVHGFTATESGAVLTVGALGWSAGSQWQSRSSRSRPFIAIAGAAGLALGVGAVAAVMALPSSGGGFSASGAWVWLMAPAWAVAGAGMGLCLPALNVIVMDASADDSQGANSSGLQIADTLGSAISAGLAGAVVAGYALLRTGVGVAEILTIGIAVAAVVVAFRTRVSPDGRRS